MLRHPFTTAEQLAKTEQVSATTVRKHLAQEDLVNLVARTAPVISPANIVKRVDWAAANKETDWRRFLWTDESAFQIGDDVPKGKVWRKKGRAKAYEPQNRGIHKRKGGNVHVWGSVMFGCKFPLVRFNLDKAKTVKGVRTKAQTINSEVYSSQILWGPMQNYWNQAKAEGRDPLVLEDGASVHFKGASARIRPLLDITNQSHPPSSPDLNISEGVWVLIKGRIRRLPQRPSSLNALWEAVQHCCADIRQSTIDRMIESMVKRREEVEN